MNEINFIISFFLMARVCALLYFLFFKHLPSCALPLNLGFYFYYYGVVIFELRWRTTRHGRATFFARVEINAVKNTLLFDSITKEGGGSTPLFPSPKKKVKRLSCRAITRWRISIPNMHSLFNNCFKAIRVVVVVITACTPRRRRPTNTKHDEDDR